MLVQLLVISLERSHGCWFVSLEQGSQVAVRRGPGRTIQGKEDRRGLHCGAEGPEGRRALGRGGRLEEANGVRPTGEGF